MERFAMLRITLVTLFVLFPITSAHSVKTEDPLVDAVAEPFTGDFLQMKKDRVVRVLISFSITDYYLDKGKEKGLTAEVMREFEKFLNRGIKKEAAKIEVVLIPAPRDQLLPALVAGHGDIAVANLTITPERLQSIEFSDPVLTGVSELVVTHVDQKELGELTDLAGMEIHARPSSSYYASLKKANEALVKQGLDPVKVVDADEWLEDEDLLEMVDAGIIPAIVMDDHKAKLWSNLFKNTRIHASPALREGGEIAWAFRKKSPQLKKVVNSFVATIRKGSMLGNIFAKRYRSDIYDIVNPRTKAYTDRLLKLIALFEKYGEKYDIDPMLLAAQAFQESRFDNKTKSHAGAVGIMQLLPSTARGKSVAIKNFRQLEGNIEAGAKYNRFLADRYFADESISDLDRILFVFASYNAGPNRVARLRKKAKNPNVWFGHVEWQVARAVGAEPVKYVKNIYVYYLLFAKIMEYERRKPVIQKDNSTGTEPN